MIPDAESISDPREAILKYAMMNGSWIISPHLVSPSSCMQLDSTLL